MAKKLGKKKSTNKKVAPGYLAATRKKLQKYVDKANQMVSQLINAGRASAPAITQAMATKSRRKDVNQDQLFSVSELRRKRDIEREAARIRDFLGDSTSQLSESAFTDTSEQYREKREGFSAFSGHYVDKEGRDRNYWMEKYGKRFDLQRINEDAAKQAWRIYRQLESENPTSIYGEGAYGSENLIIAVYDMYMTSGKVGDEREEEIMEKLRQELKAHQDERLKPTKDFMSNRDFGVLEDAIGGRIW